MRTCELQEIYEGLYDGPHATPKPSNEGPVFLGIKNITEDGRLDLTAVRHIAEDDFENWTRRVTPMPGDIVFSYEATLHRYAVIPEGFRGCLGRRMALIRLDKSKVNSKFIFHYFFSDQWRDEVKKYILVGSTVDRIPLTKVPEFIITIPEKKKQDEIAGILSAYDSLIENNNRRIAILESMAQLLYREWFVNFHFPGHENCQFVDSALGRVPEGWGVKPVSAVVHIDPATKVPKEGEKPFVPMSGLSESLMLIDDIEYRVGNSGSKFRNGDTLFARITPCLQNGKTGFVHFLTEENPVGFGSTEFIVLRSNTVCPEYVYCMARSQTFRDNAIKSMSGATGRQRVRNECFNGFLVAEPAKEILNQFKPIAESIFNQVYVLHRKNINLKAQRDMLLPRLVSGQIELDKQ